MKLKELASKLTFCGLSGDENTEILGIQMDSRKVYPGDLFICIKGRHFDGHDYAQEAIKNGAAALLLEQDVEAHAPKLFVAQSREAMAILAAHFYGYPSHEMKVIGITGTNGKTSSSYIIEKIIRDAGFITGVLGTIGIKVADERFDTDRTTLESMDLQRYFRKMSDARVDYCLMEVASIALEVGRVKGIDFRTALFTNLTQDHLDDHGTMDNYKLAKGLFFARLGNTYGPRSRDQKYAVLNADDSASAFYSRLTAAQVITYGIENQADVMASHIEITPRGTSFHITTPLGSIDITMKLIGRFNVYNALGAIACCILEGIALTTMKQSLQDLDVITGRMESIDEGQEFLVLVDYAHTPDGIENALSTIREFTQGRVITVVGCGGDRDRTKRPIMGQLAAKHSDYILVTSDNPRSEDPASILQDIEVGLHEHGTSSDSYELITDRRSAIQRAIEMAESDDVVLIAGKGHETVQIINGITYDFDDRLVAREVIRKKLEQQEDQ
jgi:UDP-N-acetylmuramoyl-L-alanyl-D-glutamate--2,6-diaminopimelate ligase